MPHPKRLAVVINLDWTMKHHHEVFAGIQDDASSRGWKSVLSPFPPGLVEADGHQLFDGIIGRVHPGLEKSARAVGIPLVNVWSSSPCRDVPSALPDMREAGLIAGRHLLAETDLLIKQVAEACGFANSRRFSEVFQRIEWETPEGYRRERVGEGR